MRIFHIATVADWEAARTSGSYTTSTHGRSLAEEGYIHASRGDQWQAVRARWYADVTEPLVLLVIDAELLGSPVVDEPVPGGETFPHVYGPIEPSAVVQTIPLDPLDPAAPAAPVPAPTATVASSPAAPAPAVVAAPVPGEPSASFSRLYLEEVFRNVVVASVVLAVVVAGALGGRAVAPEWGALCGSLLGLVVGVLVARRLPRKERSSNPAGR